MLFLVTLAGIGVSTCYEVLYIVWYRKCCGKTLSGMCEDGNGGDESDTHSSTGKEDFLDLVWV